MGAANAATKSVRNDRKYKPNMLYIVEKVGLFEDMIGRDKSAVVADDEYERVNENQRRDETNERRIDNLLNRSDSKGKGEEMK